MSGIIRYGVCGSIDYVCSLYRGIYLCGGESQLSARIVTGDLKANVFVIGKRVYTREEADVVISVRISRAGLKRYGEHVAVNRCAVYLCGIRCFFVQNKLKVFGEKIVCCLHRIDLCPIYYKVAIRQQSAGKVRDLCKSDIFFCGVNSGLGIGNGRCIVGSDGSVDIKPRKVCLGVRIVYICRNCQNGL